MRQRLHFSFWLASLLVLAFFLETIPAARAEWQYAPDPTTSPMKAKVLYLRAIAAFQNSDPETAIQLCKAAMQQDHGNKHIIHLLAMAYGEAGDNYNANMWFRSALTLDYNFVPCRNNYGLFLHKTGKDSEAKKMFEECIRIAPNYPDAYYHRGELSRERGDLDHAIADFETATRLNPNYWQAQRDLGLAVYERAEQGMGDIADSLPKLQIAAKLVPNNPMIWYHMGTIYCSLGKLDDAESCYRNALMRDPRMAAAHWELAKLRYYRGDTDRCLAEVAIAEKISPVYGEGKNYPKVEPVTMKTCVANCLESKGKNIEAVDAWKEVCTMRKDNFIVIKHIMDMEKELRAKAKKKKSKNAPAFDQEEVDALVNKGIKLTDNGDVNGAKQAFNRALELNPDCFEAIQNLGAILEAQGDLNGAMAKYRAAMAIRPDFDGAYFNFAYLLEKMNLTADAGMEYQKFHELAGKYPYDPKHIVSLQQEDARERAKAEEQKKRGY